jgi:DNA-binding beta-propeller fold protein YncE
MQLKSKKAMVLFTLFILLGSTTIGSAADSVEWNVQKTLKLEAVPVDVAVSPDGKRIFVLTGKGQILIYRAAGSLADKIEVGSQFDHIEVGPGRDQLILNSSKNKSVQVIALDFIQSINVSGSPFKGPENAAVVIAVFDDFE